MREIMVKNQFYFDRRRMLKLGVSSTLLAVLPMNGWSMGRVTENFYLEPVSNSELPVAPDVIGQLKISEFSILAALATFVNDNWSLDADMEDYHEQLEEDLTLKTSEEPSYLTEYKNAIELYWRVREGVKSDEEAWLFLLFSSSDDEGYKQSRLGRARKFVFSELITYQIPRSESFKSFGLINYTGYFGGSYMEEGSYRRGM